MKKITVAALFVCAAAVLAAQVSLSPTGKFSAWKDGYITTDDGCKIHYIESGTGAKTVLYVHGYLDAAASFRYVAQYLTGDYRIVAYDLRAHGTSDTTKDGYTMDRYAKDLKNVIDGLKLTHVNVIGYSMGMHIVWEYIRQYGDGAFDKIVNTVMSPNIVNDPAKKYNYGITGVTRREADAQVAGYAAGYKAAMIAQQEAMRPYFAAYPQYREFYERSVNYDPAAMTGLLAAMYGADYWDVLPKITKPVLMVTATYDVYPRAGFDEQKKRLKVPSSLVVIEGVPAVANHSFAFNVPDRYAAELQKFID
jgi:pimeloyl-ACP methyl ester carboxylesterase